MSDVGKYLAAGVRVFDGKTPNKCPDCDFTTTSFGDYSQHRINVHPLEFLGSSGAEPPDPVMEACLVRCIRAVFTGDLADAADAMREYAKSRKEKN